MRHQEFEKKKVYYTILVLYHYCSTHNWQFVDVIKKIRLMK